MPAPAASSRTISCRSGDSAGSSSRAPLVRSTMRSEKNHMPMFIATPAMAKAQAYDGAAKLPAPTTSAVKPPSSSTVFSCPARIPMSMSQSLHGECREALHA